MKRFKLFKECLAMEKQNVLMIFRDVHTAYHKLQVSLKRKKRSRKKASLIKLANSHSKHREADAVYLISQEGFVKLLVGEQFGEMFRRTYSWF